MVARKPSSTVQKRLEKEEKIIYLLPACPMCPAKFSPNMRPEMVNAHLSACARKAAQQEEAAALEDNEVSAAAAVAAAGVGACGGGGGGETFLSGRPGARRMVLKSAPMAKLVSSHLAIAVGGEDVVSVVAALEGLSARGLCPSAGLCDRAMHELLQSRYVVFQYVVLRVLWNVCIHGTM